MHEPAKFTFTEHGDALYQPANQWQMSEIYSYVAPGVDKLMEAAHVLLV